VAPIPRWDVEAAPFHVLACSGCGDEIKRKRRSKRPTCPRCAIRRAEQKRKSVRHCQQCGGEFRTRAGNFCSQRCVNLATRGGTVSVLPES
jgi:hypothetical protein